MTKTYSKKSNAVRATKMAPGSTVKRNDNGLWFVSLPTTVNLYLESIDGVDEPASDDVPVVQIDAAPEFADDDAEHSAKAVAARNAARAEARLIEQAAIAAEVAAKAEQDQQREADAAAFESVAAIVDAPIEVLVPMPSAFRLSVSVTAAELDQIAALIAKRTGRQVDVCDAATGYVLRTVTSSAEPKIAKAKKTTAKRQAGEMTKVQRTIVDLSQRVDGVTGREICAALGWKAVAARTVCQGIATKFGYILRETPKTDGRGISFRMETMALTP